MQKTVVLNSGVTCEWLEIYNINLENEEIECSLYLNEDAYTNQKWPVENRTVKAEGVFTEDALSPVGKTPKILAEEFLATYDFWASSV